MTDPEICAETVKRALRELGAATPGEVARHLGIESAPAKLLVRGILRDLKKSGGALRDGKSRYTLADDPERRGSMQEQIWRAACLKAQKAKSFSLVDLAFLTGASHDYLKKYVHFLAGAGFLEALGRKRHATIFRVAPGQEKELPPHWNRRAEKRSRYVGREWYIGPIMAWELACIIHPTKELSPHWNRRAEKRRRP